MTSISLKLFGVLEKEKHLFMIVVDLFYHLNCIWYDLSVTW